MYEGYTIRSGDFVEIDSLAYEGEDFRFGFKMNTRADSSYFVNGVYVKVYTTGTNGEHPPKQCALIPLEETAPSIYTGSFRIPRDVASFMLSVRDGKQYKKIYQSPWYLVMKAQGIPVRNARATRLRFMKGDYLAIFQAERQQYPENIGVFVDRWNYEGGHHFLEKDSVASQLRMLESQYAQHPYYPYVAFIGKYLVEGKVHEELLERIAKDENGTPLYNNAIAYALYTILSERPALAERVFRQHPLSVYAYDIIRLIRYDSFEPETVLQALKNRRAQYNDMFMDYHHARVLFRNYPDSMMVARTIMDSLVGKIEHEYAFFAQGLDPNEHIYHQTNMIFDLASDICLAQGDNEAARHALDLIEEEHLEKQDFMLGIVGYKRGNIYLREGKENAALQEYMKGYYYLPSFPDLLDSLHARYMQYAAKGMLEYDAWLDSLQATVELSDIPLPKGIPPLTINGMEIDLTTLRAPVVLVFWSATCSFCDTEMRDLAGWIRKNPEAGHRVYIIANNLMEFRNTYPELLADVLIAENPNPCIKAFHVESFPVTIVLGAGGAVQRRLDGYADTESFLSMLRKVKTNR